MHKFILGFFLLTVSLFSFSQTRIVQGPFNLDSESSIYFKEENNSNYPLAIYFKNINSIHKVESYGVNGSKPHVETVFFARVKSQRNVIVLISWRQKHFAENIDGELYQVFAYIYDSKKLIINPLIENDNKLSGVDGVFNGEELTFKYKNADEIKKYLKSHYK